MKLLTEQEKNEITQAIKEAEKQTSCEIVVAEISHCDDYNSARFTAGIILALIFALFAYLLYPANILGLVLGEMVGFLIGFLIINPISFIKRLLVSKRKIQDEVHYRALAEFYKHGLYKTKDENGILIMLSVFERMVVILGDKGINAKIPSDYWETIKDKIIMGIKLKKGGVTIAETIKFMTNDIKKYFPVKPDDKNELPNEVIN